MATTIDVIEKTRERLQGRLSEEVITGLDYTIEQAIPQALRVLAEKVMKGDRYEAVVLQKNFTGTITGTTVNLTTLLTAAEPLLCESPFGSVTHPSVALPFEFVPDRKRLQWESSPDFAFYTLDGPTLVFVPPDGLTLTGNVTIQANFVPLLSSLPEQLVPPLVSEIVALIHNTPSR
jgi:hypothetical protein